MGKTWENFDFPEANPSLGKGGAASWGFSMDFPPIPEVFPHFSLSQSRVFLGFEIPIPAEFRGEKSGIIEVGIRVDLWGSLGMWDQGKIPGKMKKKPGILP